LIKNETRTKCIFNLRSDFK